MKLLLCGAPHTPAWSCISTAVTGSWRGGRVGREEGRERERGERGVEREGGGGGGGGGREGGGREGGG